MWWWVETPVTAAAVLVIWMPILLASLTQSTLHAAAHNHSHTFPPHSCNIPTGQRQVGPQCGIGADAFFYNCMSSTDFPQFHSHSPHTPVPTHQQDSGRWDPSVGTLPVPSSPAPHLSHLSHTSTHTLPTHSQDSGRWDPSVGAVLMPSLKRSDKVVCAMAAGCWLLDSRYAAHCKVGTGTLLVMVLNWWVVQHN